MERVQFMMEVQSLGENSQPILLTQSEYMRRMKDISRFQQGMAFYQEMPDSYVAVLNADHPLIKKVLENSEKATGKALKPIESELKGQEARLAALRQSQDGKKPEELSQEEKDDLKNAEEAVAEQKKKKSEVLAGYAKDNKVIRQLIDLALLQNGMLKGAALSEFLKRSVEMIR